MTQIYEIKESGQLPAFFYLARAAARDDALAVLDKLHAGGLLVAEHAVVLVAVDQHRDAVFFKDFVLIELKPLPGRGKAQEKRRDTGY